MNSSHDHIFDQIKFKLDDETIDPEKRSFWVLLSSLVLFVVWIVFLTYYLSRIAGPIVSFILNRYLRFTKTPGHIKLTSFSLSLLGGKLMFKDLLFANDDYSLRINDAWIVFSYWNYVPGRKINFKSNSSRLHLSLNGLQIHVYNRVQRYKEIAKLFRMEKIFGDDVEVKRAVPIDSAAPSAYWDRIWSLVGVIKLDIWSGRVVVGNRLLPYMLVVSMENMNSKVRLRESAADRALLSVEGQAESVRASFLKHPEYKGMPYKDPPRTMGDGFAILQSALLHFFYHQDILGYVTVDEQSLVSQRPIWESIWRFDHNTVISYGPWAEQQRVLLYSFFFPSDYQTAVPDELPKRGKRRIHIMHDVRISLLKETSIDVWFMRGDQLESVHSRCQPGSTIDMSIWWITKEEGFSWSMHTSLLRLESTSSLPYRKLLEAETFSVDAEFKYPRVFNAKQTWDFKFRLTKCCCWLVWDHQRFVSDLINEFVGDTAADLVTFIPYTVIIDFDVSDSFEAILLLNESNWVDPSEKNPENVEASIVGSHFNISFTMPFEDFLPELVSTTYTLRLENSLALRLRYPPGSATAPIMAALARGAYTNMYSTPSPHGRLSKNTEEWHEIWRTESITCTIDYTYHPTVPRIASDLPLHVLQEFLPKPVEHPKDLPPDKMNVKLEIGGSEVMFTGSLIKCVIELKNNYFGIYDSMTDVTHPEAVAITRSIYNRVPPNAPVEAYRPMEVLVDFRVFNIRAHCLTYASFSEEKSFCPVLYTEEIAVVIKKGFKETIIQTISEWFFPNSSFSVGVGPCAAYFERAASTQNDGYLTLSGLQFRGHAMFSSVDCPWDMAVVEYCWLTEILVGEVGGCFGSPSQIITLVNFLDTLLLLVIAKDDAKIVPDRFKFCQHGQTSTVCSVGSQPGRPCESEERLKYRQMRISVDGVQLALTDESNVITLTVDPIRFTLCNAHEKRFTEHICVRIPQVKALQLFHPADSPTWIECARASISGVSLDVELPHPTSSGQLDQMRQAFIQKHDKETKRLHFLWDATTTVWSCACYGDTAFITKDDPLGQYFLIHLDQKLCVHSMNQTPGGQPGVFQNIVYPEKKLFREELRQYFAPSRKTSTQTASEVPSMETASFHSAMSKTIPLEKCLLSVRPLTDAYGEYLNHFNVASRAKCEAPQFGAPGEIAQWVDARTFNVFQAQEGISSVHLTLLAATAVKGSQKAQPIMEPLSGEAVFEPQAMDVQPKTQDRKFVINGSVGSTMEIFFTPLAIEALDRLLADVSRCVALIHPSMLVQTCYRECVNKQHRQPLTESLFTTTESSPLLSVSLDLPRVHIAMFECSILPSEGTDVRTAANMAAVLLQRASVSSGTTKDFTEGGVTINLNSSVLSAQFLHFTPRLLTDFAGNRVNFKASVDWEKSPLAARMLDIEPRVVVDFQVPDVEVSLERRDSQVKPLADAASRDSTEKGASTLSTLKALHMYKMKIDIGAVNTLIVMPRPLEMTGKNEFPLYDVLSPCLTTWLHVSKKLSDTVEALQENWGATVDMTLAQVLKLALDSTDDRIFNAKSGRCVMSKVTELGAHQASCPSCLLLHTVLRWCALPQSAEKLAQQPPSTLAMIPEFAVKAKRKTALMALLSHWHPDICQQVKLASNAEARKFRVDPSTMSRDVRITMEEPPKKTEPKHRRNPSTTSRSNTNVASNGTGANKRRSSTHEKVDLYHWLLSVHREPKDRKSAETSSKEYLNPMDIMPQAFFFSFYRSRRLEWTNLDELPLDQFSLAYVFVINNVVTAMVEQRVVSSAADSSRKFITPHLHQLVHVKRVAIDGKLSWHIEMDEKGLLPERGIADIAYNGTVENVRFVVALCSVCLIKEIALVSKTLNAPNDLKKYASTPVSFADRSPLSVHSLLPAQTRASVSWDVRVLDMMRDFEKNRSRSTTKKRGDVVKKIRGELEIDSVRLESILTDLYVSVMVQLIGVKQQHDSDRNQVNKSKKHIKSLSPKRNATMFDISLRKASLALMESDNAKQNMHIVNCTLHESNARLSSGVADGENEEPLTTLRVTLGAIEGELPVAAHSLHDVVMRHGPQLEQQFNRLSAQPVQPTPSNPIPLQPDSLQEVAVVETAQVAAPWQQSQVKPEDSRKPVRPRAPVMKIKFDFETSNIELRARLLPSLLARYKLNRACSSGITGNEAKWTASIQNHYAEFCVSSAGKPMDTFTLALPAVAVNGEYTVDKEGTAPATNKTLLYREGGYLKVTITLGQVNHSFTTDLLNQILFAEQSFRTELSALITRLRAERFGWLPSTNHTPQNTNKEPLLLFSLMVKGQGVPWLQLTAATPTATAVRFTIESLDAELTNRWVLKELGSAKERLFGAAMIQFNAKLGQLVKVAEYEELQAELQEYATFMTQVRVENKETSSHQSYSYHIALNRPILLIKSSAIDKAILLWLNYKNTYDYWRAERSKVVRAATAAGKQRSNSFQHAMFSPPQSQDFDVNLSLAINNGMYVCMPLYSQDLTDGMPALVLSLQKSDVTVCIMKELACQASFHGFKLNFIDNFDELSLSESVKEATGNTQTNYLFFPQGTYQLCSQASSDSSGAKWVLSVRSQMRGMVIDLDQRIGKFAKMVVNTFSSLGENEDDMDDRRSNVSDDDPKIEGAGELKNLRPEERVPWMERKMHEQSTLVSDLIGCKASEKRIEAERGKLRQYELMRFKEFRRSMIEKIRRRKDTGNKGERRPRTFSNDNLRPAKTAVDLRASDTEEKNQTESVQMNIDVQVSIESGRCTLRTALKQEASLIMMPAMVKKPSTKDLRAKAFASAQPTNFTRFSIPSLDMKGYYISADSGSLPASVATSFSKGAAQSHPSLSESVQHHSPNLPNSAIIRNRGCFYLSAALASMPTETVVTPHLADYLEQVLEPLPISSGATVTSVPSVAEQQEGVAHIVGMDTSALPIDVLFFLTVQSSTIRFDGQQQRSSAADCLLKLPCLSLMASTRRTVEDTYVGGIDVSATLSAFSLSIYSPHQQSTAHDALSLTLDHLSFVISRSKNSSVEADNRVKFVLTSNIGAANFNYDMRRLSELMAFPKPWYRAAIARRVFFGDQAAAHDTTSHPPSTIASHPLVATRPVNVRPDKAWSATVLLAVQWKELNVNAQMSNTMGNTSWRARRGLLRAIAKLNSRSERNVTLTFKLDSSELTAHGGAISGEIALSRLLLSASHKRNVNQPPRNGAKIQLRWLAARVEWMSRAVLIGRCEKPAISLGDEFSRERDDEGEYIRACVRLNVKGSWEDLQLVITRCTVDDIQKIINKLKTFFEEQLKSSKMVWGIQEDSSAAANSKEQTGTAETTTSATKIWQKVLDTITQIQFKQKILPIPKHGETVVGGFVGLEAGRLSLACMHGEMNAHSWALFHLRRPGIIFTPEAKFSYIDKDDDVIGVALRQKLIIRLGPQDARRTAPNNPVEVPNMSAENMATVCRVQQNRNTVMRQNASISTSLDYLIGDVLKQIGAAVYNEGTATSSRGQHSVLELFQFPALEAVLVSDQMNECDVVEFDEDERPEVHSTFVCDFLDAVCVQTDFNAQVSFLPELLKSYMQVSDSPLPVENPVKTDKRRYLCEKWAVDPKIRFIDRFRWNPPVIDEVLRKLQIFDHRTTIPKALQRALLDPLDKGVAKALYELLRLVDQRPALERNNRV